MAPPASARRTSDIPQKQRRTDEVAPLGGRHVLVVEDDPELRAAIVDLLRAEGCMIAACADGRAALDELQRGTQPDVILLDLLMPVMNGWEFRVEQKKDPALAAIPVLVMTGDETPQARAMDCAGYVRKPLDAHIVLQTIENVLARGAEERMAHADRLKTLGVLASGVAHEVANPLTYVVENLTELAKRLPTAGGIDPELLRLVDESLDATQRIARLIREIQTLSGAHEQQMSRPLDVRQVVEGALRVAGPEIRHRAQLVTRFEETATVIADPQRLEQVFVNLLVNAAHAIVEGDAEENYVRVTISTDARRGVQVDVADTGQGMSPAVVRRIFDPFFTTKPAGVGTGLGLAICQAIVTGLGGHIAVDSRIGSGTLFRVTLPAADVSATLPPAVALPRTRGRMSILIVDDEPSLLRAVARMLPGHDVVTAQTGHEALAAINRTAFDLLLMDLSMPDVTASSLLEEIAERDSSLADGAVIMTGGAFTPQGKALIDSGAHRVLPKPFSRADLEQLLAITARALDGGA